MTSVSRRRFVGLITTLLASRASASQAAVGSDLLIGQSLLANGLGYTPFRDGQGPDAGIYPTIAELEEDLAFLGTVTKKLRTYGALGVLGEIPRIAAANGISVAQGISLGDDEDVNRREIEAGIQLARSGLVDSLIVGNEVLSFSKVITKDRLVSYLRRVRDSVPGAVRVTTADLVGTWKSNVDLAADVDNVMIHIYPFWANQPIEGAAASVIDEFYSFQRQLDENYPLRRLKAVIGETGWPSAGMPRVPGVVPSPENQLRFLREFVELASASEIPFYYFSAFDEEWKWREGRSGEESPDSRLPLDRTFSGNYIGASWGLFKSNGSLKPQFADVIAQRSSGSRRDREILVNGQLRTYYDAGVDSSEQRRDWLTAAGDALRMSYPSGQAWGAVFFTIGPPTDPPRPWKDFTEFGVLSIELRGERTVERIQVGVKTASNRDDGGEKRIDVDALTTYQWVDIPLSSFSSSRLVIPDDLSQLYVVCEFVFAGSTSQTIYVRNIRYKHTSSRDIRLRRDAKTDR